VGLTKITNRKRITVVMIIRGRLFGTISAKSENTKVPTIAKFAPLTAVK
jgi:hypothetical protein